MDGASDQLSSIQPGTVGIVEIPSDAFMDSLVGIVGGLLQDGSSGILVNVSRPYQTLHDLFEQKGMAVDRLYFIDAISKMLQAQVEEGDHRLFLDGPTMLEMIAMGVDHFADDIGQGGFVVFDSYGSLLNYNDQGLVYEFTNFLGNKLRLRRLRGVLIVAEGQLPEEVRGSLMQLADTVEQWRPHDGRQDKGTGPGTGH